MKRFVLAAVLVAALGPAAGAQPGPAPNPDPVPPLPTYTGPPGPAVPFVKSGGRVIGADGYYTYDSGNWLLGGTDGVTRQSGWYTMVYPGGNYVPASEPAPMYAPSRHPLFRGHFHKK